jgi:hypothetical protein
VNDFKGLGQADLANVMNACNMKIGEKNRLKVAVEELSASMQLPPPQTDATTGMAWFNPCFVLFFFDFSSLSY